MGVLTAYRYCKTHVRCQQYDAVQLSVIVHFNSVWVSIKVNNAMYAIDSPPSYVMPVNYETNHVILTR